MNLDKNQNIDLLLDQTKKMVTNEIAPFSIKWEAEGKAVPNKIIKMLGDLGFFGLLIGSKFGGANLSIVNYARVTEVLAMGDCGLTNLINVSNSPVALAIEKYGSLSQQSQYLTKMAEGRTIGCFMLSEPASGSDASSIETTAERVSDGYIINGRKKFITGGATASVALVAAKTNKKLGVENYDNFIYRSYKYNI